MKSDMTLGAFFEQFVEHRRILTAPQKDEVQYPKREAQNFLLRLDERYAEMLVSMDNGSITGKAYPGLLLEEAYEMTRLWVIPTHKKVATSATAFVVSEEGSRERDGGGRGSRGGSGRGTSGRGGRGPSKRGSPPPKLLKKTVKFVKEEPKGTEKADTTGWVVPPGCEPVSKTCSGCLKKGHIWINCPDNTTSEKVLVGKENDEDDWEEADEEEDWRTYVIAESCDRQSAMFLPPGQPGIPMHLPQRGPSARDHRTGPLQHVWHRRKTLRYRRKQNRKHGRLREDRSNLRRREKSVGQHTRAGTAGRRGIRGEIQRSARPVRGRHGLRTDNLHQKSHEGRKTLTSLFAPDRAGLCRDSNREQSEIHTERRRRRGSR